MKAIINNKNKYNIGWGNKDCRPKKENGVCKQNHSHLSVNVGSNNNAEIFNGLYLTKFESKVQCENAGNQINSFLRSLTLNGLHEP